MDDTSKQGQMLGPKKFLVLKSHQIKIIRFSTFSQVKRDHIEVSVVSVALPGEEI